ncbi:MAG: alkaline phosphatase family protein [Candidatus Rokubacteria bacterium]|nr:alkaline phosphatase family protein [Candidatus Rokubacteria bacterium]
MAPKVIVIGLDGATFTLLKPWMDAGHLPSLKALMEQGASGPLRSSIPPVTVPAWQCFMTGKNPAKIGVAGFFVQKPGTYDEVPVSAAHCKGRSLWELLNEGGQRVAVLNVPYTVAPKDCDGVFIGGFDTPPARIAEAVHPPGLLAEIEREFGPYRVYLTSPQWLAPLLTINRFEFAIETFIADCQGLTDYQFRVANWLLGRDDFDFVMLYQLAPDRIQHWLWYILDDTHPWHDPAVAARYRDRIIAYYDRLDAEIGRLIRNAGGDPVVMIVSDHGFGSVAKGIDLNSFLLREGYLAIRDRPSARFKHLLWRLGWGPQTLIRPLLRRPLRWKFVQRRILKAFTSQQRFHAWDEIMRILNRACFLATSDIDWTRSRAYCLSEFGMIRLNVRGREPHGVVDPAEYPALRDRLVERLRALVDPARGPVDADVFTKEATYHGEYLDAMPDIAFIPFKTPYLAVNSVTFVTRGVFIDDIGVTGFHQMDGILIAKGPSIRKGATVETATLMDIAPTILHVLGLPVPDDMDGRVVTEMLEAHALDERPVTYAAAAAGPVRDELELSEADQAAVLERLRGLGYID